MNAEKYRVYFTDYKVDRHVDIFRWDWGIGAGSGASTPAASNGGDEYDVPQCPENKAGITQTCQHTISGTWMPVQPDGTLQNQYAPGYTKNNCDKRGAGKCQVYLAGKLQPEQHSIRRRQQRYK